VREPEERAVRADHVRPLFLSGRGMLTRLLASCCAAACAVVCAAPARVAAQASAAPDAVPNDNRAPGGTLREGVLAIRLVARDAAWRPDGPDGGVLAVHAFAEEGKPARIPGPLIRVLAGTEVRATVRNALATPIWVRGLQDRVDS